MIVASAPLFLVKNLIKSLDYYCDILGFTRPELWGEPPFFAMPDRDGFIVMLRESEEKTNNIEAWDAYFWIKDANLLFTEFKEKGAIIAYEPELRETYGCLEFAIKDIDDHLLAFGQDVENQNLG